MLHFDYRIEFTNDSDRFKDIGGWPTEVFMMNGDADITISEGDSSWQFSVPVMNLVDSLVTASEKLSDSNQLVEFKDWDSSFTISFVLAGNTVLIESDGTKRFHTPILEFKSAVAEFSERVKIDLETRYPDLIKNKAFQRFFLRGQNEN